MKVLSTLQRESQLEELCNFGEPKKLAIVNRNSLLQSLMSTQTAWWAKRGTIPFSHIIQWYVSYYILSFATLESIILLYIWLLVYVKSLNFSSHSEEPSPLAENCIYLKMGLFLNINWSHADWIKHILSNRNSWEWRDLFIRDHRTLSLILLTKFKKEIDWTSWLFFTIRKIFKSLKGSYFLHTQANFSKHEPCLLLSATRLLWCYNPGVLNYCRLPCDLHMLLSLSEERRSGMDSAWRCPTFLSSWPSCLCLPAH